MTKEDGISLRGRPHVLYRAFTAAGELLYVGLTVDPAARFRDHESSKGWWDETETLTLERHPDRASVEQAEQTAIREERPRYNIRQVGQRPGRRNRPATPPVGQPRCGGAPSAAGEPMARLAVYRERRAALHDDIRAALAGGASQANVVRASGLSRQYVARFAKPTAQPGVA